MTTLTLDTDPTAIQVALSSERFTVDLADGRSVSIPLEWYPRLMNATRAERNNWQLLGDGYAIEWPDLDEHIGIECVLAGHRSGESIRSLNTWLATRAEQRKKVKARSKTKQSKKKAITS
ncbi:MAG: DUF2442 domain-containing protein [Gemmataceae bacterium]|nr:DUF2442 domain-containing protein [Gemmataceae bacterium]